MITKERFFEMKRSQYFTWDLFFEFWLDKGGEGLTEQEFSEIMGKTFPKLAPGMGDILIIRVVEYFEVKLGVTKIISREGELLKEY